MNRRSKKSGTKNQSNHLRILLSVVLGLALIGVGVAVELTSIHYNTHTDTDYHSVCAVNEDINCETVARSPYSIFLNVPISVWGILGYTLIGVFAVWGLSKRRLHPTWPIGIILMLVFVATIASSILAYLSFTLIDSLCLFCMTLYLINIFLIIAFIVFAIASKINLVRAIGSDFASLLSRFRLVAILLVLIGGPTAALPFSLTPYWHHVGWSELPKLQTGVDKNGLHWMGAENPLVQIVEFSDYECPHCRRAHKSLRALAGKYPDTVRVIHRHMPLDQACNEEITRSFHEHACQFSRAAECAADQDKFWEMNDALFSIQDMVKAEDVNVESLAVQLGLDRSQFKECMNAVEFPVQIKKDLKASQSLNVKGTPTFYLNGQMLAGGVPAEVLDLAVKRALEKKK